MEVKRHRLARTDTRIHNTHKMFATTHTTRGAQATMASTSSSSSSSSSSSVRKQTNRGRGQPLMAKKQSWTAREIQTKDSKQKEIENSATPIDSSKITVPKVMQEKDFWDDEMFESVGDVVGKWGLVLVAVFAAISGIIASKTYNEGAVEVDFTAYDSPEEAVAASVRVAAAPVKKNSVVSAPTVVGEDDVVREVIVE
jgi:hypothetical protein